MLKTRWHFQIRMGGIIHKTTNSASKALQISTELFNRGGSPVVYCRVKGVRGYKRLGHKALQKFAAKENWEAFKTKEVAHRKKQRRRRPAFGHSTEEVINNVSAMNRKPLKHV